MLVDAVLDKKGNDILLLDIREQAIFTDFFLICSGDSNRQIDALAESITEKAIAQADIKPWGIEGDAAGGWVLVDFGAIVVHLFSPDRRNYYKLEELWQTGRVVLRMA